MSDVTTRWFGILIAYVLPGFLALWGVGRFAPLVREWLAGSGDGPSAGGVPYVLLASVGAGMTASVVRWAVVDTAHRYTGLTRPAWDDSRLVERLDAYRLFIEIHYRYYQFYANSIVAGHFSYAVWRAEHAAAMPWVGVQDAAALFLTLVFAAGSRDTLRLYYRRTAALLGESERKVSDDERRQTSPPPPEPSTPAPDAPTQEPQAIADGGDGPSGGTGAVPSGPSEHAE